MEISNHETRWLQTDGAKMLEQLGVRTGNTVVDYGCGEGRYTVPMSQVVGRQGTVYSVERDERAIAVVTERLAHFSEPNIVTFLNLDHLETADILPDRTVDAVFAFDVLQYVKDWDLLFGYFAKILKPNGIACIYPAAVPHPGDVDIELVISKMDTCGLRFRKSAKYTMMHNVDMVDDLVYIFDLQVNP